MSVKVYMVRHGETCHNRKKLFQSDNEPLSDLGREQASYTAETLFPYKVDSVISSSLLRAIQTGEIIAERLGIDLESKKSLNEFKWPSDLVNKWRYSPHSLFVAVLIFININISKWSHFDGENMSKLDKRAKEVISYLEGKKGTLAVVTHRGMYAMLLGRMKNGNTKLNLYKTIFNIIFNGARNTEITVCDYDGEKWSTAVFDNRKITSW